MNLLKYYKTFQRLEQRNMEECAVFSSSADSEESGEGDAAAGTGSARRGEKRGKQPGADPDVEMGE